MQDSEDLACTLRQQILFYFSQANMISDSSLQKEAVKNSSWIPISYLLRCSKVKQILGRMGVPLKRRAKKLQRMLQQQSELKVRSGRIKRKRRIRQKQAKKNMVYIESSNQAIKVVYQRMQQLKNTSQRKISVKLGSSWMMVIGLTGQELEELIRQCKLGSGEYKLIGSEDWQKQEQKYESIVKKMKKHAKQNKQQTTNL